MKKSLLLKTFLSLFAAMCLWSEGFSQTANYQELILQVPAIMAQRNLVPVKTDITSLGGVLYVNFCQSNHCLLLKIDRNIHPNDAAVLAVLKGKDMTFEVKQGVSIAQINAQCTDTSAPPAPGDSVPDSK